MTLFTVGYEGCDFAQLLSLLREQGIQRLIDVRKIPLSRKPMFSKTALAHNLHQSRLDYYHMAELGCPQAIRHCYRKDGNWQRYKKSFLSYLATQEQVIATLSAWVLAEPSVLLCYEADPNCCHRLMVADAVRTHSGINVKHLVVNKTKKATADLRQPAFA